MQYSPFCRTVCIKNEWTNTKNNSAWKNILGSISIFTPYSYSTSLLLAFSDATCQDKVTKLVQMHFCVGLVWKHDDENTILSSCEHIIYKIKYTINSQKCLHLWKKKKKPHALKHLNTIENLMYFLNIDMSFLAEVKSMSGITIKQFPMYQWHTNITLL